MARTMDMVEQIAVALLASTAPVRPQLQQYITRIVTDAEHATYADAWGTEYQAGSLNVEMHRSVRDYLDADYAATLSDAAATELQMDDHRALALADAIVAHRQGRADGQVGLAFVQSMAAEQAALVRSLRGLPAAIVTYTASLTEAAARLAQALDDAP